MNLISKVLEERLKENTLILVNQTTYAKSISIGMGGRLISDWEQLTEHYIQKFPVTADIERVLTQ